MSNLPAVRDEEPRLPCEFHDRPSLHVARRLNQLAGLEGGELRQELLELRAILAGMRITQSRAEVEVLESRLKRAAVRLFN